ncbi:MAG: tetratricopeptide repeat protein [Cyanobacteria bacterium P01_G01_bin.54]
MQYRNRVTSTLIALAGVSLTTLITVIPGQTIPLGKGAVLAQTTTAQTNRNQQLDALLRQGRELVEAGQYRRALQVYHQAVRIDQSNAKIYSGIGYLHTLEGSYTDAAQAYEYALILEPNSIPFRYALAHCFAQLDRHRAAENEYRAVLRLDPNHVESHLGLGVVLMRQGRHRDAYRQYEIAARLNPQDGTVYGMMATALLEQDRPTDAVNLLRQATARYPRNSRLWMQLGIFLMGTTDDQAGAIAALDQSARLDPSNPDVQIQLGAILLRQGNAQEAQRMFYRAITVASDTYAEQERIGDLLYNQAIYSVAILAYRRATQLDANNPAGFHRLGLALEGRSRKIEARTAWEMAMSLYRRQGNTIGVELMQALLDGEDSSEPRFKPFN